MGLFKLFLISCIIFWPPFVWGQAPDIKTPAPLIYLEDNLDERDKLGWCIDTIGRGFSDKLHAHSCKPRGGDVQFLYREKTLQIISVTFNRKCVEIIGTVKQGAKLSLVQCENNKIKQKFNFKAGNFKPIVKPSLCIAVGIKSRPAGPFMARKLRLTNCETTNLKFRKWLIKEKKK